ncbi:MAG TPA: RNA 2',3'-cyclic phosphodiesterase [Gaiellaceae bacterium]|nr:RNA 2',3'-cyclic phosphodiesterase [Gaiellaceae bacterium]
MGGDERLRLFLALRLPSDVLDALARWQRDHLPGVRTVGREQLHVTLAFLGHRPAAELDAIVGELHAAAAAAEEIRLTPVRYRETRSVGMLVLDDEAGAAAALAGDLHERLERLGVYEREGRPWLPHLTVARWRERPRLQPKLPPSRTFVPSDAAAYLSRLRPGGAEYRVLESVAIGARVGGE